MISIIVCNGNEFLNESEENIIEHVNDLLFFLRKRQIQMIFTAELLEKVTSAVLCSFDGASSNQEKQKAFEYLEDLKENHPMVCLTIAFEFFKLNQQAMFHHYGLHLIESIIKYKWTGLKLDERTLVKDQLFLLIKSNYLTQNFIDPIYIRNSLTKCLIELIKRDCFDKGQTTFDEIVTMTQGLCQMQGELRLEIVIEKSFFCFVFRTKFRSNRIISPCLSFS